MFLYFQTVSYSFILYHIIPSGYPYIGWNYIHCQQDHTQRHVWGTRSSVTVARVWGASSVTAVSPATGACPRSPAAIRAVSVSTIKNSSFMCFNLTSNKVHYLTYKLCFHFCCSVMQRLILCFTLKILSFLFLWLNLEKKLKIWKL